MPEPGHKSSVFLPTTVVVVIVLALLLLAYPLSIGPIYALVTHNCLSGDVIVSPFYWPLNWACNNVPGCNDALDTYLWIWSGFGEYNL